MSTIEKLIKNLKGVIADREDEKAYWGKLSTDELREWHSQAMDAKTEQDDMQDEIDMLRSALRELRATAIELRRYWVVWYSTTTDKDVVAAAFKNQYACVIRDATDGLPKINKYGAFIQAQSREDALVRIGQRDSGFMKGRSTLRQDEWYPSWDLFEAISLPPAK